MNSEYIRADGVYRIKKPVKCGSVPDDGMGYFIVVTSMDPDGDLYYKVYGTRQDAIDRKNEIGECCYCVKAEHIESIVDTSEGYIVHTQTEDQYKSLRGKMELDNWDLHKYHTCVRISADHETMAYDRLSYYKGLPVYRSYNFVTYDEYIAIRDGVKKEVKNEVKEHVTNVIKNTMNIVDKVKFALKTEPEKSLIKAGIFDREESLTADGRAVLEMILVEKFKDELKANADIIIKADEQAKK